MPPVSRVANFADSDEEVDTPSATSAKVKAPINGNHEPSKKKRKLVTQANGHAESSSSAKKRQLAERLFESRKNLPFYQCKLHVWVQLPVREGLHCSTENR